MTIIEQINQDFRQAMLDHDDFTKTTLNGLKSAIKYREVEKGARDQGLDEAEIQAVVAREAKARADAMAIYQSAGDTERADKEARERQILMKYLPEQLTTEQIGQIVDQILADGEFTPSDFGKVMGLAKAKIGNQAEGGAIAAVVKEKLK